MTDTPQPHNQIADLLAVAAAQIAVADAELGVLEAEEEAVDALGIDLDAISRQASQDAAEAKADQAVWADFQRRRAAVTDDTDMDELNALVQDGKDLVARFQARRERRAQHEEALARVAQARALALAGTDPI